MKKLKRLATNPRKQVKRTQNLRKSDKHIQITDINREDKKTEDKISSEGDQRIGNPVDDVKNIDKGSD